MDFVHPSYDKNKTIAAIATPPGEGGISVIRISGPRALAVGNKIFSGDIFSYKTHTAHLGKVIDPKNNQVIDKALALVMLGPKSFTGEDTLEIHCHGGRLVTQKVLELTLEHGAEPALAGEFSMKAFLNGKIDLSQAEAIQDLISAKNEFAMKTAKQQLLGKLKEEVLSLQKTLIDLISVLDAYVDYPEEGLDFMSKEEFKKQLTILIDQTAKLCFSYKDGKVIKDGLSLCLVGLPNVGKSSLLNALLKKERAIVTKIPGTTRDLLEEDVILCGMNFRLIDTAGIRNTKEMIEQEGIKRSKEAYELADLILFVIDLEQGLCLNTMKLYQSLPKDKTVVILNKCDSSKQKLIQLEHNPLVKISAKEHLGLDELKSAILEKLFENKTQSREDIYITNARHYQALKQCLDYLNKGLENLSTGLFFEFISLDLKEALKELGTISGLNITEDILSSIFSKFCVGK